MVVRAKQEDEVAVFRFTLGSNELDEQVPRIIGTIGAILLVVNHVFSNSPTEAQLRYVRDGKRTTHDLSPLKLAVCVRLSQFHLLRIHSTKYIYVYIGRRQSLRF